MKDIKQGILQVQFMNSIREILNASGETFIMAETTYRPVLEGLQEMQTCFPLARYIVECKTDIKPPQYARGYGTTLNIRHLLKDECRQNTQVTVLLPTRWPPVENTPFNQSQYDAVKTALTKEIAIIQGPPGTGKTCVGLKVAKVLLDNREVWTSKTDAKPMLVVCYTNHALDQFLEGILEFCPNGIVRVGSRCKTEQLERFNLKRIRAQIRREKRVKLDIKHSINDCFKGLCNLRERVERVSARLEATAKGILGESALRSAMPDNHYSSLVSNIQRRLLGARQSVMINWLTQGMLGESDETSYKGLEQEVTQQILEGTEMQHELSIDASQIPFLHPKMRAQMYRLTGYGQLPGHLAL
ncbi:NFX1-type zinc finger-containing protein 1-like [Pomacea canaliculata]|uniref:NFX1-type zinc finger-containing protein 1-like n=1 Tax=Pomacea canaliculata TaxID=400727 RepID=UPI000D727887|nr:NFX1-type zinc finger-containing protein 1-like [Pomacea canaliculata]